MMRLEQDIPPSCGLCVFLYGPLEVWKRTGDGTWKPVEKEVWGKGRVARSVFKRLLVSPGRRLSRGALQDDLWPDSEHFELADKNVYNAINQIRQVIGKTLVRTVETSYEIAHQSLVWVDCDACEMLLKEAENLGYASIQALPLLEQALEYLERGELLEGESGIWVYGLRKKSEDLLRQCRLWLAENYEAQGKLLQAGLQYRALLQTTPPDEKALQQWIALLQRQGRQQEAFKLYRDIKAQALAQGFTLSPTLEQTVLSLNRQSYLLLPPLQTVQPIEQPGRDVLVLTDSDVADRLTALLTKPSVAEEVTYFDQQTRLYWRAREESALSVTALYLSLVKYMDSLTMALARSYLPSVRQQLCETISKTTLLAGILLYDMGQYAKARQQYRIAFRASVEAGNPVLQGIIWGWASFTWTYSQQYQKALHCVQSARHLVTPASDLLVQAWLAAIEAEIQAHFLNRNACMECLNILDTSMDITPSPDTAYLFEFNPVLLLGYKGVCLQRFYQEGEPGTHSYLREAKSALEEALASEAPQKRKLYYLIDLASAYARQGEVERACAYVAQSLPTVLRVGGSKTIYKHLFQVRTLLQPYESTASLQALDEQLHLLQLRD
jgi:DNA-binding SARP family transcriptional activator